MDNIKLKNFYVCESVIIASNNQPSLINLIDDIVAVSFPALQPRFSIVTRITGDMGKYTEKIEVISALGDKTIVTEVENTVEIEKSDEGASFYANFLNILFEKEGKYWIKVSVKNDRGNTQVVTNESEHFLMLKKS